MEELLPTLGGESLDERIEKDRLTLEESITNDARIMDATIGEKFQASWNNLTMATGIPDAVDWGIELFGGDEKFTTEDMEFKNLYSGNFDATLNLVKQGFDGWEPTTNEVTELMTANNQNDLFRKANVFKQRFDVVKDIQESIGETAQLSTGIAGALLGPETLAGLGVFNAFKLGKMQRTMVAAEAGTVYAMATARDNIDMEYTDEDYWTDIAIGGMFLVPAGIAANRVAKAKKIGESRALTITSHKEIQDIKDEKLEDDEMDEMLAIPFSHRLEAPEGSNKGIEQPTPIALPAPTKFDKADIPNKSVEQLKLDKKTLEAKANPTAKDKEFLREVKTRLGKIKKAKARQTKLDNLKRSNNFKSLDSQKKLESEYMTKAFIKVLDNLEQKLDLFADLTTKSKLSKEEIDEVGDAINDALEFTDPKSKRVINSLLERSTEKLKGSNAVKMRKNKDGSYSLTVGGQKSRGKIPAVIALSLLAATTASASDGEELSLNQWGLIAVVAMVGGAGAIARIQKSQGIKNFMRDIQMETARKMTTAKKRAANQPLIDSINDAVQAMRTRFTETHAGIAGQGDKAKELVDLFVQNVDNATTDNVAHIADSIIRRFSHAFSTPHRKAVGEFMKAQGKGLAYRTVSKFADNGARYEFEMAVSKVLRGEKIDFDGAAKDIIIAEASRQRKLYDDLFDDMAEIGLIERIKVKDYFPRVSANGAKGLIQGLADNPQAMADISEQFTNMIFDAQKVKDMEKAMLDADKLIESLGKLNMDELDKELFGTFGGENQRLKDRINMDYNSFKPFIAKINGVDVEVTLDKIYDFDAANVFNRYIHTVSGHMAFKQKGFDDMTMVDDAIAEAETEFARGQLLAIKNLLIGRPAINDIDGIANNFVTTAKNLTIAAFMSLGAVPMIIEVARTTILRSGNWSAVKAQMNEFAQILKNAPESELSKQLGDFIGHGRSAHSMNTVFRGMGDMTGAEQMMQSRMVKFSATLRDSVLLGSQMVRMHDWLSRINMVGNMETLANVMSGKKKLSDFRAKKYGITDETFKLLGDKFDIDDIQGLKAIDMSTWSKAEQDEMRKVMDAMQEYYVQNSSIGGSSLLGRTSTVGSLVYSLLNFPLQSFANHGLFDARGTMTGDVESMASTMAWFAGAYISTKVRAEINGQELTDEEVLYRALGQMSLTGAFSGASTISQGGVAANTSEKMLEIVKAGFSDGENE